MNKDLSNVFQPLSIELIDEGEFVNDINQAILDIQQQLESHRKQYADKSEGAKASLKIGVEMMITDPDSGGYAVKSTIKAVVPDRPATVSLGIAGRSQSGHAAVLVRSSGSSHDHPDQSVMFDRHGETVGGKSDDAD